MPRTKKKRKPSDPQPLSPHHDSRRKRRGGKPAKEDVLEAGAESEVPAESELEAGGLEPAQDDGPDPELAALLKEAEKAGAVADQAAPAAPRTTKKTAAPEWVSIDADLTPPATQPSLLMRTALKPGLEARNLYPVVALVGRPNVGKSSIFNAILRDEVAITDARAGTTRDRVLRPVVFNGKRCDLMDTGGIGIVDTQRLSQHIQDQISAALQTATVLIFVVDSKDGITPLDREVAQRLRALNRPVVIAANKCEGREAGLTVGEFSEFGFEVFAVSAAHRQGMTELQEAVSALLPAHEGASRDELWEHIPRIALAGRRNVGKSSFCNTLARQERVIVSDLPGTTRDSVDILMEKDGRNFCLIDTAGLRRMKMPEGPAEFYSKVRTERSIHRAHVVLLMLEAKEGVSTTDQKTADLIIELQKPVVLVVNKWDTVKGSITGEYARYLEARLPSLRKAPICFTSAKDGSRCWQTLDVALELYDLARTEIPTPKLNKAIEQAEREHEPPVKKGRKPRLLYGVQVGVLPPTIVIHSRHSSMIDAKYRRYLNLRLGKLLGMEEIPLRVLLRDAKR